MKLCFATPIVLVLAAGLVFAEDCNQNGAEDAVDISGGASSDCNRNGVPDDCELGPGLPFGYAETEGIPGVGVSLHPFDIEGDGDLDIAAGGSKGIDIIESEGGILRRVQHVDPPGGILDAGPSIDAADLDLDGDLDLVASFFFYPPEGALFVLRNQDDGTFGDAVFLHAADRPRFVIASELDGDGTPDLLTNKDGAGFLLVSGASGEGVSLLVPDLVYISSAATGDLDGDEDREIVFAALGAVVHGVFAIENLGSTSFGEPANLTRNYAETVQVLDAEGDGDLDVANLYGFSLNDGTGSFTETLDFQTPGTPADVDGDGDLDLFRIHRRVEDDGVYEDFNGFSIRLNEGGNVFGPAAAFSTGGVRWPLDIAFLHVNGDGRPDLVLGMGGLATFLNDGLPYSPGDADRNGVLDVCEMFYRGDVNSSGEINITDPIRLLNYLFMGDARDLPCLDATDANNDGEVDISDGILLLFYSFGTGRPPAPPGPDCGKDPEGGDLGCTSYTGCGDLDLGS